MSKPMVSSFSVIHYVSHFLAIYFPLYFFIIQGWIMRNNFKKHLRWWCDTDLDKLLSTISICIENYTVRQNVLGHVKENKLSCMIMLQKYVLKNWLENGNFCWNKSMLLWNLVFFQILIIERKWATLILFNGTFGCIMSILK